MILLDSDHVSVLKYPHSGRATRLVERLSASGERIGTTVITVEEQMRGWLAAIAKERLPARQVRAYRELADLFTFFASYSIAAFDDHSATRFEELRQQKLRVGTMDLKIAAIALTSGALLLTANRQDFEKVPGLRFENWLDE
jgi:tRNA(fMet)-specific endonuclease VapC